MIDVKLIKIMNNKISTVRSSKIKLFKFFNVKNLSSFLI